MFTYDHFAENFAFGKKMFPACRAVCDGGRLSQEITYGPHTRILLQCFFDKSARGVTGYFSSLVYPQRLMLFIPKELYPRDKEITKQSTQ